MKRLFICSHCIFLHYLFIILSVPQGDKSVSLSTMMDNIGLCDMDLREQVTHSASLPDTQALLKLFLSALNRVAHGSTAVAAAVAAAAAATTTTTTTATAPSVSMLPLQNQGSLETQRAAEPPEPTTHCDHDLRLRHVEEEQATQDYLEVWAFIFVQCHVLLFSRLSCKFLLTGCKIFILFREG